MVLRKPPEQSKWGKENTPSTKPPILPITQKVVGGPPNFQMALRLLVDVISRKVEQGKAKCKGNWLILHTLGHIQ